MKLSLPPYAFVISQTELSQIKGAITLLQLLLGKYLLRTTFLYLRSFLLLDLCTATADLSVHLGQKFLSEMRRRFLNIVFWPLLAYWIQGCVLALEAVTRRIVQEMTGFHPSTPEPEQSGRPETQNPLWKHLYTRNAIQEHILSCRPFSLVEAPSLTKSCKEVFEYTSYFCAS